MSVAIENMKRCGKCHEYKPLAEFHRNRATLDGFANRCRGCRAESDEHTETPWKKYMVNEPGSTYIAGEMFNFHWTLNQLQDAIKWWNAGVTITDMAKWFDRTPADTMILLMDLEYHRKIRKRKGGIWGE